MSSLVLMRWLENSPERYDAGMRILTFGCVAKLHTAVADAAVARAGDSVLEIGCGTGAVTAMLLARGAEITALDQAPEMLQQAMSRLGSDAPVRWLEQTASEIDRLPRGAFDSVVLSLCLSDMSAAERGFVLREAALRLAVGGRLVVADEVHAIAPFPRFVQRLWRIPQAALGWLLVGSLSRPLADLAGEVSVTGLEVGRGESWLLGTLGLVVAERAR